MNDIKNDGYKIYIYNKSISSRNQSSSVSVCEPKKKFDESFKNLL